MPQQKTVPWYELDKAVDGLVTKTEHEILVQREAIPIIFVPGVMGSRLRRSGTDGKGKGADGLPNLRWDPAAGFLYKNYSGKGPLHRKKMLIGDAFDPDFLEPDNADPVGDGYQGLMEDYRPFLARLRTNDWGQLGKLFVFPVYGFGYNWGDSNRNSGKKLAARIDEVIQEGVKHVGRCEKVILITHSMGGLVARAACRLAGAEGKVLGVIHGVLPAYGAPAAYWRIKAGFEGDWVVGRLASRFLGPTGRDVTALLANAMGGLQLLPNKRFRSKDGKASWLKVSGLAGHELALPKYGNPYDEIYRVPAVVTPGEGNDETSNAFWGLVDPELLTPELVKSSSNNPLSVLARKKNAGDKAWKSFLAYLAEAESFHDELGTYRHPNTWRFHGSGLATAEIVEMKIESNWVRSESYPTRGFRGYFRAKGGSSMQAVLQDPAGDGDGTVPVSSATFNDPANNELSPAPPLHQDFKKLEHQPAYENGEAQRWTICAITALCKKRFEEKHG